MSRENVKAFYSRLTNDAAFHAQIQGVKSKAECSQIVKAAGYDFTQQEYEEYTAQLLESGATDGELKELSEKEIEAVFGGATSAFIDKLGDTIMMYGLPPTDEWF